MAEIESIEKTLRSDDPLPDNILDILLCQEESIYHDFKKTHDINNDRDWLKITKDFLAFANTDGGYLAFGISDKDHERIGLEDYVYYYLSDANRILQKINKYIAPAISKIFIKRIELEKRFIVLFVSASQNTTHIVEKNGSYRPDGKSDIIILRAGEIYIRKAGQTAVATHSEFEDLMRRRMEHFKDLIFNNVSKVIRETEPGKTIGIIREAATEGDNFLYKLSNSDEAVPVKGLVSTIPPKTLEEFLCAAIAFHTYDESCIPPNRVLYDYYANRLNISIPPEQLIHLLKFGIIKDVPIFYWLQYLQMDIVSKMLLELFEKPNTQIKILTLKISRFVDKKLYKDLFGKFPNKKNLGAEFEEVDIYDGYNLFIPSIYITGHTIWKKIIPLSQYPDDELSREASNLAAQLRDDTKLDNDKLWMLDCKLYAAKAFNQMTL